MKRLISLVIAISSVTVTLLAQINRTGTPLISSFDAMDTPGGMQNLCITMDNRGVMFFGNQKNGIITYNGLDWDLITLNTQQKVTALATDRRGIVYVGGTSDFGLLQPNNKGILKFVSLADRLEDTLILRNLKTTVSIASDTNNVYYTDRSRIYIYDVADDELSVVNAETDCNLTEISIIAVNDNHVIVADNRKGLFELKGGKLSQMPGGSRISNTAFVAVLPYTGSQLLVATCNDGLFIYNYLTGEVSDKFLSSEVKERIPYSKISSGVMITGNMYAFGLENGEGIYIFNHDGRMVNHISSETTDLPESTITAMYCDYKTKSQLWFCSMGYINRAYISLPVYEFGAGTGLQACLGEICKYNGSLYVSFDLGILKSYTDADQRIRFEKVPGIKSRANSIKEVVVHGSSFLFAATDNGLYLLDNTGRSTCLIPDIGIRALHHDISEPSVLYAGTENSEIITLRYSGGRWLRHNKVSGSDMRGYVTSIAQTEKGKIWFSTAEPSGLYCMNQTSFDTTIVVYKRDSGVNNDTINQVVSIDNKLLVCTGNGLYSYNNSNAKFIKGNELIADNFDGAEIFRLYKSPKNEIWLSGRDTKYFDALILNTKQGKVIFRRQFDILPDVATTDVGYFDGSIWLVKGRSIYVVNNNNLGYSYGSFNTILTRVVAGNDSILMDGQFFKSPEKKLRAPSVLQPKDDVPVISHSQNSISFRWTTTSYVGESKTEYRHKLEPYNHEWSKWEKRSFKDFTNLQHGSYTFRLRARTITGLESEELLYKFVVRKPWYGSISAIVLYIVLFAGAIYLLFKSYTRRLIRENLNLESLVKQRTEEVVKQKDELESSIHYASRIQRALLPSIKLLDECTQNYFILFKPRDIVSGDFYWLARKGDRLFIAAADCTGHGVPGAFMSLLGISFLEEIVSKNPLGKANQILNKLRHQVVISLKQVGEADEQKDGMDLGLIIVDYKRRIIEFAGAYNPCLKVRKLNQGEVTEWKMGSFIVPEDGMTNGKYLLETVRADKMPIGISFKMDKEFTRTEWIMDEEISYYLFTDGYIDQFNGHTGKKFLKKNLKQLLLEVQDHPMGKQKEILEERLLSWQGSSPQIDDILILGLKI